jgi:hypothetical protein
MYCIVEIVITDVHGFSIQTKYVNYCLLKWEKRSLGVNLLETDSTLATFQTSKQ